VGLISGIEAVKLVEKNYDHTPQAKVLKFQSHDLADRPDCQVSTVGFKLQSGKTGEQVFPPAGSG
jgi:hypothetical protein